MTKHEITYVVIIILLSVVTIIALVRVIGQKVCVTNPNKLENL